MKKQKIQAFTLVELIVVIVILAVLWTIAFISLQSYSESARDSTRVADISKMKTSLELFQIDAWKYPLPTESFEVTYSGWLIWTQWNMWDQVITNLKNLNKKPVDPLRYSEYTYSVLNTRQEYEIGAILEWWWLSLNIQSYAATDVDAYISWTYNGLIAKVSTGATTYVLAVPTIITTDRFETIYNGILSNQKLAYNGTKNIPASYVGYTQTGWFDFNSGDPSKSVVYEWQISDLSGSGTLQIWFIEWLQSAYTGTTITENADISNILSQDTVWDEEGAKFLAQVLISQTLDKSLIVSENSGWSTGWWVVPDWNYSVSSWMQFSCAVRNWWVKCWWDNTYGQLWDNSLTDRLTPIDVSWLTSWVNKVSVWYNHSCVLLDTWWVKCWGRNAFWQLWDNSVTDRLTPIDVSWLTSSVVNIYWWWYHTCALLDTWWIKCWWYNSNGQIWDNSTTNKLIPTNVSWLTSGVSQVDLWQYHTCALLDIWWVKCWGYNNKWQLWDNSVTDRLTPVDVTWLTSGVSQVDIWNTHSCALLDTWWVKCWWYNSNGQLWNNSTTDSLIPVDVSWLSSWGKYIFSNYWFTCAVMDSSWVKCWWDNSYSQLWDNTNIERHIPVDVVWLNESVVGLSGGSNHVCALISWWWVKCWWNSWQWQLWDGTQALVTYLTPVTSWIWDYSYTSFKMSYYNGCMILNGWAKCWWTNYNWQLWDGTDTLRSYIPVDVVWLTSWVTSISTFWHTACAVHNGAAKCWWSNTEGQLWDGTTNDSNTPVQVSGLTSWVESISVWNTTVCAVLDTGWVKCWWNNAQWQVWDGTTTDRLTPVDVSWLTSWVSRISVWIYHVCALLDTWWVKCWGWNNYGQLWNSSTTNSTTPVQTTGLTSWVTDVQVWWTFTCWLLSSWAMQCWGANSEWQLWIWNNTTQTSPTTPSWLGSWVTGIKVLWYTACVLQSWWVKCMWDNNGGANGKIWDGTEIDRVWPTTVTWLSSGVSQLLGGPDQPCVLMSAWWVKCWWKNANGQFLDYDYYLKRDVSF